MIEGVDILDLDDLVFLEQIHDFFEVNHGFSSRFHIGGHRQL